MLITNTNKIPKDVSEKKAKDVEKATLAKNIE
jgi:hypothetical protein